jgi:predicted MFS family arabinose efflux permease
VSELLADRGEGCGSGFTPLGPRVTLTRRASLTGTYEVAKGWRWPPILGPVVWLVAIAAGVALADGSIVTLALPELLRELGTSVEGVAAVLGVYCAVVAVALPVVVRVRERWGSRRIGVGGLLLFAAASLGCATAHSLPVLLSMRAAQGLGAACLLVLAFDVLAVERDGLRSRRWLWTATAVLGTAAGPALGGLLAQAFGWRAIFLAQVPIALTASLAVLAHPESLAVRPALVAAPAVARARHAPVPMTALALTAAALSSVLFLLVLLLVSGWGFSPLQAAGAMMLVPAGAAAVRRVGGAALRRAAVGCTLLGAGVLTLAFLPSPSGWWLLAPLLVAGAGMGLALPALAGELLHERTPRHAARLLAVRHAGIALTLLLLAPIIAVQVRAASDHAELQGVAALLDSSVSPGEKLKLASAVASSVQSSNPRAALADALAASSSGLSAADRAAVGSLQRQGDAIIVQAADDSVRTAFLITGLLALLAAALLRPPRLAERRGVRALAGLCAAVVLLPAGYAVAKRAAPPGTPQLAAPCKPRPTPQASGFSGVLQSLAIDGLDSVACREGITREQLVLNLIGHA